MLYKMAIEKACLNRTWYIRGQISIIHRNVTRAVVLVNMMLTRKKGCVNDL